MAPVISSITPTSGPAAGGTAVTITGTGFTGTTSVKFGTASAAFTVVSSIQITATTPAGSGSVVVTVTTAAGTSNGVTYTYASAPVISALSPNQGPTAGGTTVTITGTNLAGAISVEFGCLPATITGNTATQVTVTAPAAPAAPVSVSVATASGTSNPLPYYYLATPTVTSVDPSMGPAAGGNTVTITGSSQALTQAVHFGSGAATNISVISDTQITAVAPAGTGTVTAAVTTPGGTSLPGSGNPYYTYVPAPVITSLSPNQGSASGGVIVTITGSNLTYTSAVLFGTTPAAFTTVSDIYVVATAPAGTPGSVTVTVRSPGGTSNGATYQRQP